MATSYPVIASPIESARDFDAVMEAASAWRMSDWVASVEELKLQYSGMVAEFVQRELAKRYKRTWQQMPINAFEWVSLAAFKGSTVYDTPTNRSALGPDLAPLKPEAPEAKEFSKMLRECRMSLRMAEADRVRYLAHSVVVHVRADTIVGEARGTPLEPRMTLDVIWPTDCFVIVHPNAPTDLQACLRFIWRTGDAGTTTGTRSYMDWRRDYGKDADGRIRNLGKWRADLVTVHEKINTSMFGTKSVEKTVARSVVWDPYPLDRLPFFASHRGTPQGMPFMRFPSNVARVATLLNTSLSSEDHTVDMVAAPVLTLKSDRGLPSTIAIGPGVIVPILLKEELDSVTQTADLAGIRATNKSRLDMLALTERQRPGSFTGEDGAESGVALKIKSIPAEKARREDKEVMGPFEAEEILPALVEAHDYWRRPIIGAVAFDVEFPDPPDFESKAERQERLLKAQDAGIIDKVRVGVDCDYYANDAEATREIARITAERAAKMATAMVIDRAPREGSPPVDDDENDDEV